MPSVPERGVWRAAVFLALAVVWSSAAWAQSRHEPLDQGRITTLIASLPEDPERVAPEIDRLVLQEAVRLTIERYYERNPERRGCHSIPILTSEPDVLSEWQWQLLETQLNKALRDGSDEGRLAAMPLIRKFLDQGAFAESLVACAESENRTVSGHALSMLTFGSVRLDEAEHAARLQVVIERTLRGEDHDLKRAALQTIRLLGREGESLVPLVVAEAESGNRELRVHAYNALTHLGPDGAAAIVDLANKAQGDDRVFAIRAAAQIGELAAGVVPVLVAGLESDDNDELLMYLSMSWRFGAAAKPLIPKLAELARHPDADIAGIALTAISELAPLTGKHENLLIEAAENDDAIIADSGRGALARFRELCRLNMFGIDEYRREEPRTEKSAFSRSVNSGRGSLVREQQGR